MNKLLLRRRPIKLGRAAQHMTDKGFVLISDVDGRATWRKEWYDHSGRMGFTPQKMTRVIQLEGPNRHDGEIIEEHNGRMYIKER
jgi:hypothetical protein